MASKKTKPSPAARPVSATVPSNLQTLSAVLGLFRDSGLHELEFEDAQVHVRLTRSGPVAAQADLPRAPWPGGAGPTVAVQPAAAPHPHVQATHAKADEPAQGHVITSPFVGTFYRAANPTAAPFVQVGSMVKKGQTLCIIEAMKLMNEIEADEAGKVVEILAENARAVEFGQKLFRVVPS